MATWSLMAAFLPKQQYSNKSRPEADILANIFYILFVIKCMVY